VNAIDQAGTVRAELESLADPEDAVRLAGFFKTGPGQYGEGDLFLGIRAPVLERVARRHRDIDQKALVPLLESPFHEERMVALRILRNRYRSARSDRQRMAIYRFYEEHSDAVDNWDLVDLTAPWIIGGELLAGRRMGTVRRQARSTDLWTRRRAVVATLGPVRAGSLGPALEICAVLVPDREDLIQKATGWVLREVGKRDRDALTGFLDRHGAAMGRTSLRYSIERLPEGRRRHYLKTTRSRPGA